jgi:hypothetical protein
MLHVTVRRTLASLSAIAFAALVACSGATEAAPSGVVFFQLDAPLCSSIIPVQFSIDQAIVATDTFMVHVAGGNHTRSRAFETSPGAHTLSARTVGGYVWPDKQVTITAGAAVTDSLPFYCS